jgi:Protein of unknown function (DUF3995)
MKRAPAWAPLAAAAWALAFAGVSFYWAAGGEVGLETVGEEIERDALARDPDAIALVWVTGGLKVLGAALALALLRPRGPALVRRAVGLAGWIVGIGLLLYAAANFIQHGLMAAGAIDTPDSLGESAVTWHLALWDPVWLLGGVLFTAAARRYSASATPPPGPGAPGPRARSARARG